MKKLIALILICLLLFTACSNNNYKLIVDGKEIENEYFKVINDDYAEIPFLAVIEALHGDVNWVSRKYVEIHFHDTDYILDPEECCLLPKEDYSSDPSSIENYYWNNLIAPVWGAEHGTFSRVGEKEFIIDSDSIWIFFESNGIRFRIDRKKSEVSFTLKTMDGSVS